MNYCDQYMLTGYSHLK